MRPTLTHQCPALKFLLTPSSHCCCCYFFIWKHLSLFLHSQNISGCIFRMGKIFLTHRKYLCFCSPFPCDLWRQEFPLFSLLLTSEYLLGIPIRHLIVMPTSRHLLASTSLALYRSENWDKFALQFTAPMLMVGSFNPLPFKKATRQIYRLLNLIHIFSTAFWVGSSPVHPPTYSLFFIKRLSVSTAVLQCWCWSQPAVSAAMT